MGGPSRGEEGVPNTIRPGDVLADRYLLVDLLSESGSGRFWRAHDRTLDRHVSVHVLAADDQRAPGLMDAARLSAAVHDRRFLRVLDVDEREGLCYVVNEWGSGRSIDILVGHEGAVGGRRAAWIVAEVAESIAAAHDAGVAHGRLVPENVMIDHTGSVRIIGLAVEAALLGLPPGRMSTDVTDLAGLLYYLLTAKWPGISRSGVPAAPLENGRVLRPRQVKAGVQRPLDTLCEQVLNAASDPHGPGLRSAHGIREALHDFVGDVAAMAEAEASAGPQPGAPLPMRPRASPGATIRFHAAPDTPRVTPPAKPEQPGSEPGRDAPREPDTPPAEQPAPAAAAPDEAGTDTPSADLPTQAGVPIFDDENDEVSWLAARAEKPPPPPPFEEPPERPLFAPEPADGRPARTPRPGGAAPAAQEFWPWEAGTGSGVIPVPQDEDDDEVPGRRWMRLAFAVAGSCLLLIAIVFAFNLGRGRSPLGTEPDPTPESSGATASTAAAPITGVTATDFDPQGDPPEENRELAPLAVDGDPSTGWRTVTYEQDLGPAGLKTGVGLRLDLGSSQQVTDLDLTLVGGPSQISVYLSDTAPRAVAQLTPVAEVTAGENERVTLDEPGTARYVVLWFTSLPQAEGGYRGEVAEVVVRG
jgi:serine/threonine kinase PknH